jgi:hypothetical protein
MTSRKQEKAVYDLFFDIYGGFFFKREDYILKFFSRRFNEHMFDYNNGDLIFKDELLFNSIGELTNTTIDELTELISKYFNEKFHIFIKKITK